HARADPECGTVKKGCRENASNYTIRGFSPATGTTTGAASGGAPHSCGISAISARGSGPAAARSGDNAPGPVRAQSGAGIRVGPRPDRGPPPAVDGGPSGGTTR